MYKHLLMVLIRSVFRNSTSGTGSQVVASPKPGIWNCLRPCGRRRHRSSKAWCVGTCFFWRGTLIDVDRSDMYYIWYISMFIWYMIYDIYIYIYIYIYHIYIYIHCIYTCYVYIYILYIYEFCAIYMIYYIYVTCCYPVVNGGSCSEPVGATNRTSQPYGSLGNLMEYTWYRLLCIFCFEISGIYIAESHETVRTCRIEIDWL